METALAQAPVANGKRAADEENEEAPAKKVRCMAGLWYRQAGLCRPCRGLSGS